MNVAAFNLILIALIAIKHFLMNMNINININKKLNKICSIHVKVSLITASKLFINTTRQVAIKSSSRCHFGLKPFAPIKPLVNQFPIVRWSQVGLCIK